MHLYMTMGVFYTKVILIWFLYTLRVESQMTIPPCSQQGLNDDAECDNYDFDVFLPSKWMGNYTCSDESKETQFVLDVTNSSFSIGLKGIMYIDGEQVSMDGSFASVFRIITMQSYGIIKNQIANRYFSNLELNGILRSPVFIDGLIIFQTESGTDRCPMELRKQTATMWCNGHGTCQRYGRKREELVCCCDQNYSGIRCELEKTTVTVPTESTTTTPTTVPCNPVNNCTSHYTCGPRGQKICWRGWTGADCDVLIPDGPADCNVFDQEDFIPSGWVGNYTCNDDKVLVNFRLVVTQSNSNIGTIGRIHLGNSSVAVGGSFAYFFNTFTLQSQDSFVDEIFNRTVTAVELNGILQTPLYISGRIIFSSARKSSSISCRMELRRIAVYIDWCSSHGSCYRSGVKRDQFSCCCDKEFGGRTCQIRTSPSRTVSTARTISSSRTPTETTVKRTTALPTVHTVLTTSKLPLNTTLKTKTALPPMHTKITSTLKTTPPVVFASKATFEASTSTNVETTPVLPTIHIGRTTLASAVMKSSSASTQTFKLEDAIHPGCTSTGWNISVDISILRQLYPKVTTNHIYFGDNSCRGQVADRALLFQQGFRDCLTSERVSGDKFLYENDLFYAIYDPINPFIIRHHIWTFTVECNVHRNEATSYHVHHDVDVHHAAVDSHYDIKMTFFRDANFMNQISGNPIHASIGDDIYIKVFTNAADWTVKMRLHTCYTKPFDDAGDDTTYFIIKNGCEVDSNTHIISQSTHETRFVFQDFEYSTNKEGLNIYCNATFCETKDYSPGCAQSCQSFGTQALVGK